MNSMETQIQSTCKSAYIHVHIRTQCTGTHHSSAERASLAASSTEDKVLQSMRGIVEAIVRTNFYQNIGSDIKNYLSFKFDSSKVPDLPLPVPYAEIFVYSNDFEGIHLRGGKVARGGLRWSDRGEDYRTEVLGLMKAQMTKNAVIVPVGSKGSFYIHITQREMSQEEYMQKVVACYQDFLRGLLDVTDKGTKTALLNKLKEELKHGGTNVIISPTNPDKICITARESGLHFIVAR